MPIFRRGRRKSDSIRLLLLSIFLFTFKVSSLPFHDNRCKTGSCNEKGTCICNQPDASTILDGDLRGRLCDEEQTMCDGTNSFWCEHGARCEEIVHGENYTCKCRPGYTGEHCQHYGAPCGKIFCFHQAECLVEGDVCECPPDWKGSIDSSLPTRTKTESFTSPTVTKLPHEEGNHSMKGFIVLLAVSCSIGAVAGAVIYTKKYLKNKEKNTGKFQQLSQMQMQDFLDDEENESFDRRAAATAHN